MTKVWAMAKTHMFTSIAATLETDRLSREILHFLLANESAMDSAKGIAAWWVQNDELAVQPSLNRLLACGALLAHTLSSGTTVYGLTQDSKIRAWLRHVLAVPEGSGSTAEETGRHGDAMVPASKSQAR